MIDDSSTPNSSDSPVLTINYSKKHKIYFDDNLRVTTKHSPSNVKFLESKPESINEIQQFKYYCPICFKYYNLMMKSKCCSNYICHICALSYSNAISKKKQCLDCHYCQKPDCKYIDVDLEDNIKTYSDSQKDLNLIKNRTDKKCKSNVH